jgi:hypothetical protein
VAGLIQLLRACARGAGPGALTLGLDAMEKIIKGWRPG